MRVIAILTAAAALLIAASRGQIAYAQLAIDHVPPATTAPHRPLQLAVGIPANTDASVELRYRRGDGLAWRAVPFARAVATRYVAMIPATDVGPPGLEYFIVALNNGGETAIFGSSARPHPVVVDELPRQLRLARLLAARDGRRAEVSARFDLVSYASPGAPPDGYYRFEGAVGYLLLALPVKTLRFGYIDQHGQHGQVDADGHVGVTRTRFRGGWSEATFALGDGLEVDTRIVALVNDESFDVGGRGEVRVGIEHGSHIALGFEWIGGAGAAGHFRLAWNTVPRFPMSAAIEVGTFPVPDGDLGVRFIYDVTRELPHGVNVGARVSYQARDQDSGGLTGGLHGRYTF